MLSGDAFDTAEVEKALSCAAALRHAEDDLQKGKMRQRANSHTVSLFVDCRNILVISMLMEAKVRDLLINSKGTC